MVQWLKARLLKWLAPHRLVIVRGGKGGWLMIDMFGELYLINETAQPGDPVRIERLY